MEIRCVGERLIRRWNQDQGGSSLDWKDLSLFEAMERKYVERGLLITQRREAEGKLSVR